MCLVIAALGLLTWTLVLGVPYEKSQKLRSCGFYGSPGGGGELDNSIVPYRGKGGAY